MSPCDSFPFCFEILHRSSRSRARVGKIRTPHGTIDTPNFVAVGTNGTIKALDHATLQDLKLQLLFCNTYHLMVQPGTETIGKAGGLHRFIQRSLPLITDSGGFQVFSLAYGGVANELKSRGTKKREGSVLKVTEEGVLFRSYRDGSKLLLTPESSIQAQKEMGADIIIPLDELPPYHISKENLILSLERTHRWEERSLKSHLQNPKNQAIYGVIHGGIDQGLRQKSCSFLSSLPFDGFAIGGSIGKNREEMTELLSFLTPRLPQEKPVHLLGIGDLASLTRLLPLGIDTSDSSYPTRAARHGYLFTMNGTLDITKGIYRSDFSPVDPECSCRTCAHSHRAYLHHLFKAKEITALTLCTLHNLHFMIEWMAKVRRAICADLL